ncbi:TonB-dependent receptor plug domain-containing protein [Flavobacterium pedocola]
MIRKNLFTVLMPLLCCIVYAQQKPVHKLDELIIADAQLKKFSETQSLQVLNDSVLRKSQPLLTQLLAYNTSIYFKEYGLGMISSPSFRGTTSSQTAVVWNGININSQLSGQTDFNTLNASDFSSIQVRAGGGSVIYGSSAIGGSIHLNNDFFFKDTFQNRLRLEYGSFSTSLANYSLKAASEKIYCGFTITRFDSENDYEIPDSERKNLNGAFYNTSSNLTFGYKINAVNTLKFYSYLFEGERHLSLIYPTETPTKYNNLNLRNLLEWNVVSGKFNSKVKLALLNEKYKYYPNIKNEQFTYGQVETAMIKYDLLYDLATDMKLNVVADFTQNKGKGSDIESKSRQISSFNAMFSHKVKRFLYEIAVRQEITTNYSSPFLYSGGMKYRFSDFYTSRLNASKNFRIPSFDDLYWMNGGNPNLQPETSKQLEWGNDFTLKKMSFELVGFYNDISNMIRWLPAGQLWTPVNIDKVKSYGIEAKLNGKLKIGEHLFSCFGTYAYTVSENKEIQKQLIYVPYHKATLSLGYHFRKLSAFGQHMFVDEVFTRSDNNPRYNLEAYWVSNFGLDYDFGKKNSYKIGLKMQNVQNVKYESVEGRFMPGRNFTVYAILNLNES